MRHALGARRWARPLALPHATGTGADRVRGRAQLRAEHALLRQQPLVLRRRVKRPDVRPAERALLNQSSDENHMHYATNYVGFTCASV